MQITHRYTGEVLVTVENLCEADLSGANLRGANLRKANLSGADLYQADLSGANLRCVGDMRIIHTLQLDTWEIGFTKDFMTIGCRTHTIEKWRNFTDDDISGMNGDALVWWTKWKIFIFQAIEVSNASA